MLRSTTKTDTLVETSVPSTERNATVPDALISSGLRIGAGGDTTGAGDGSTGLVGFIDEVFVYGTALTVDELDYIYRAAQVSVRRGNCSRSYSEDRSLGCAPRHDTLLETLVLSYSGFAIKTVFKGLPPTRFDRRTALV